MSESEHQKKVCEYLKSQGLFFFAIPNHPNKRPAGMVKGVPDLFIPELKLFLEMKDLDGKPSREQIQVITTLIKLGYKAYFAYGHIEAIEIIERIRNEILQKD